jgi:hypothetical protein
VEVEEAIKEGKKKTGRTRSEKARGWQKMTNEGTLAME